ncbi:MAG: hypothetical protein FIA98_05855, partial [Anaerolineae bacterium]|nr:hypothetical protein [Anaerolineae bacterium]
MKHQILILVGLATLLSACTSSAISGPTSTSLPTLLPPRSPTIELTATPAPTLTSEPTINSSPTPTPSPVPIAEHRIGVRYVDGLGEFYDRLDNAKFVPRGMNYARVDHIVNGNHWHSTFDPALYDPDEIDRALHQMEADGYNVVRVFFDCCSAAGQQVGSTLHGLSHSYMEKVVDFLKHAKQHHIYVILITDGTPAYGGYNDALWRAYTPQISGNNPRYLTRGGLEAKLEFEVDFIRALIELQAPMDAIFAYDLTNEVHFDTFEPPFTLSAGLVTTGNGKTYDMAEPDEQVRMA